MKCFPFISTLILTSRGGGGVVNPKTMVLSERFSINGVLGLILNMANGITMLIKNYKISI